MPKKKLWVKEVRIPIYGGRLYLFTSRDAFNEYVASLKSETVVDGDYSGVASQLTHPRFKIVYVLGWFDGDLSTLVHEIGHIAIFVLQRSSIAIDDSNGETYCHLLGEICHLLGINRLQRKRSAS